MSKNDKNSPFSPDYNLHSRTIETMISSHGPSILYPDNLSQRRMPEKIGFNINQNVAEELVQKNYINHHIEQETPFRATSTHQINIMNPSQQVNTQPFKIDKQTRDGPEKKDFYQTDFNQTTPNKKHNKIFTASPVHYEHRNQSIPLQNTNQQQQQKDFHLQQQQLFNQNQQELVNQIQQYSSAKSHFVQSKRAENNAIPKSEQIQEQKMYEPPENNVTVFIDNEGEDINIEEKNPPQAIFPKQRSDLYQQIIQPNQENEEVIKKSVFKKKEIKMNAVNITPYTNPFPEQQRVSQISMNNVSKVWPSIISNLKNNDTHISSELEFIFKINQEDYLLSKNIQIFISYYQKN